MSSASPSTVTQSAFPTNVPSLSPTFDQIETLRTVMLGLGFRANQLSSPDKCEWRGVSCKQNGFLKGLEFSSFFLSGSIATEIGLLENIEHIDLSYNRIIGTIPTEIESLSPQLTYFDVYDNNLNGSIPTEIGSLENLKKLFLGENNLEGTIPSEIGLLDNVKSLYLDRNGLTGTVPLELASMDNLKNIDILQNDLTGSITHLCTSVDYVNYDRNELKGDGPGCEVFPGSIFPILNFLLWILQVFGISIA